MRKCLPTGGVHLQEVSVSGGSTVQSALIYIIRIVRVT